jgi:hypothetical protein
MEVTTMITTDEVLQKLGECEDIIDLATTPARLFILVAHLQVALRHPENTGSSSAVLGSSIAREIALNLTEAICSKVPEARSLIEIGWNPAFDTTREEYNNLTA